MSRPTQQWLIELEQQLSVQPNLHGQLTLLMQAAMDFIPCDGGTLYLAKDNQLYFTIMITKSLNLLQGGDGLPIEIEPIPVTSNKHLCSRAALSGLPLNVPNAPAEKRFLLSGPQHYDAILGYRTVSILCAPINSLRSGVIGVLQLVNALADDGSIIPFSADTEAAVCELASLAARYLQASPSNARIS